MNYKKTKIICTIGPASEAESVMKEMFKNGMNVGRINMSHGNHVEHKQRIETFRQVRDELGIEGAVLLDTKGPEIRVGTFENGYVELKDGEEFVLTTDEIVGDFRRCSITYNRLPAEVVKGTTILLDDGKLELIVIDIRGANIICKVLHGGMLSDRKGVNVPSVKLSMEYLSEKDIKDILFGISMDVDYIAASFVRKAEDVLAIRNLLKENDGDQIGIISKIESNEGIENLEEILKVSDGIMIARGDMGVEIAFEKLPAIQKKIIRRCMESGKIAVTATQMLESMISNPVPTRAEITDVANAIFDGTGAIMLSGETAAGRYPVEAVSAMSRIAMQAERDISHIGQSIDLHREINYADVTNAVGHSACTLAADIRSSAIMAITKTGYTALQMSKFRPNTPILAMTPYISTFHKMALVWGVAPIITSYGSGLEDLVNICIEKAQGAGFLSTGDKVVMSMGLPLDIPGNTNIIRVEEVK